MEIREPVAIEFRSAVFDGNSAAPTLGPFAVDAPRSFSYNPHGVDFHLNPSEGLIFIDEFAFDYLSREPQEKNINGPERWFLGPGHLVIGGFYSTDRMEDIFQAPTSSCLQVTRSRLCIRLFRRRVAWCQCQLRYGGRIRGLKWPGVTWNSPFWTNRGTL